MRTTVLQQTELLFLAASVCVTGMYLLEPGNRFLLLLEVPFPTISQHVVLVRGVRNSYTSYVRVEQHSLPPGGTSLSARDTPGGNVAMPQIRTGSKVLSCLVEESLQEALIRRR